MGKRGPGLLAQFSPTSPVKRQNLTQQQKVAQSLASAEFSTATEGSAALAVAEGSRRVGAGDPILCARGYRESSQYSLISHIEKSNSISF